LCNEIYDNSIDHWKSNEIEAGLLSKNHEIKKTRKKQRKHYRPLPFECVRAGPDVRCGVLADAEDGDVVGLVVRLQRQTVADRRRRQRVAADSGAVLYGTDASATPKKKTVTVTGTVR